MGHFKAFSILVIFTSMFLMASMCEDECDKCQSSIDHMYEKIDAQGCNPNTMQKAWDQIREDCDHFDSAVGVMAETCTFSNKAKPGCKLPGIDLSAYNIYIALDHGRIFSDEVYNIVINIHDQSYIFEIKYDEFATDITRFTPEDIVIHEGDIFEVIVEYIDEEGQIQEITRETKRFTFARNGSWGSERVIFFNLDPTEARLTFYNWDNT